MSFLLLSKEQAQQTQQTQRQWRHLTCSCLHWRAGTKKRLLLLPQKSLLLRRQKTQVQQKQQQLSQDLLQKPGKSQRK